MSHIEITRLVRTLGDIVTVLNHADPADKAEVYRQLGLRLIYHPDTKTVRAEANPAHTVGLWYVSEDQYAREAHDDRQAEPVTRPVMSSDHG